MEVTAKISKRHEIKMPQLINETNEVTYISFPSFEDFCKIAKIELFFKKIEKRRNDRDRVRKYLKRINKIVEDFKRMEIYSNDERSFDQLLPYVTEFLSGMAFSDQSYEYEKDLQIQIAKKLWYKRICSLDFFFI